MTVCDPTRSLDRRADNPESSHSQRAVIPREQSFVVPGLISDAANAPWSWELTSGENKAYPHTDQFCYLVSGMEGSVTIPRLDLWRHEGDGWWTPMNTERSIVPGQDPLTLQMRHFCAVLRREAEPVLDGRGGTRTLRDDARR